MNQYFRDVPPPASTTAPQRGPTRSALAAASLVLGILGAILFMCFGPVFSAVSIVLGVIALFSIRKSGGAASGKGMAIAGITISTVSLAVSAALVVYAAKNHPHRGSGMAGLSAFEQAEQNIRSARGSQVGFGNTEQAEEMAAMFAERFRELRELMFTKAPKGGISLSEGKFLAHCELHEETCAFLVHVPRLRKFDSEAQDALCDLAWMIAQQILAESGVPEGVDLAVGVKGAILYEKIMLGEAAVDFMERANEGIASESTDTDDLHGFFPDRGGEQDAAADLPAEPDGEAEEESGPDSEPERIEAPDPNSAPEPEQEP